MRSKNKEVNAHPNDEPKSSKSDAAECAALLELAGTGSEGRAVE